MRRWRYILCFLPWFLFLLGGCVPLSISEFINVQPSIPITAPLEVSNTNVDSVAVEDASEAATAIPTSIPTAVQQVIVVEPTLSTNTRVLESGFALVTIPADPWLGRSWEAATEFVVITPEPNVASVNVPAFVESVKNGGTGSDIVGIAVPGIFQYDVVAQPAGENNYVSTDPSQVTLFTGPLEAGIIGLLAHNSLAGASFSLVQEGQDVVVVFGDGSTDTYVVKYIQKYQALELSSPTSDFVYLEGSAPSDWLDPGAKISSSELYKWMYDAHDGRLILQTCILGQLPNGAWDYSWGRLFIMAYPKNA